ncbi:GNAT family N-acetyltransferase [Glaciecola sp. XM2]|uniref:GNAT family N-acetyltransferase n=1 Tax=Glaciecola sp. XM2 TaxID=1914931 RepID=UPI001BDEAEE2|nr:GNAT family N-acetyltransferase [Glaciecola sp. XM2]MBT1450638.1 GNAT family N-acetyltransferase [Glaciecola sp. XM2]
MALQVEIAGLQELQTLKALWQSLEQQANASPFISWHWIGPWLEQIALPHLNTSLVKITDNHQLIALGLLHSTTLTRRMFFKRTIVYLNELPISHNNMVIEYNGLLVLKGHEAQAWSAFLNALDAQQWDEVHFNALPETSSGWVKASVNEQSDIYTYQQDAVHQICTADFTAQTQWQDAQQALLSKNKRGQINRSIRAYEAKYGGKIICTAATSNDQALAYFTELEALHTSYWAGKGAPGAFANKQWVAFNKKLIENSFDAGIAQLYCISVGEHAIGYLYNLSYKGVVYNIQSGFCYESDNKLKPGYVSHWLIMAEYFSLNVRQYNFLAGTTHYKQSLSNKVEWMENLVVRRRCDKYKFWLEDTLVLGVRYLRRLTQR